MRALLLVFTVGCQAQAFGTTTTTSSTTPSPTPSASQQASTDDRASGASNSAVITLPDTVGKNQRDAEAALRAAGVSGEIKQYNDPGTVDFSVATVCAQNPGGGQQTRATLHVVLRYCQPERPSTRDALPPDLRGLTPEEATKRARAAGYTGSVRVVDASPGKCKTGLVCEVTPLHWERNAGDQLTLHVAPAVSITLPE
jgi:beta-lactam-binding protein with PASTA domain